MEEKSDSATVLKTGKSEKNGQKKCSSCGSSDISYDINEKKLKCNYCQTKYEQVKLTSIETDLKKLKGKIVGEGIKNIEEDSEDVVTIKCSSCGAEVIIDTNSALQSRCHWCRNTLSINEKIPNGAVPDGLLPFSVKKEEAKLTIENFVGKRKFFAHPKFREEFKSENVMGVFLPYMIVDIYGHSVLIGSGEQLVRRYTVTVGSGDNKRTETRYDADLFGIKREFNIEVSDLTVESNLDKLTHNNKNKTTNIINSIMPFDLENCVEYNANYIKGYSSEKRNVNIDEIDDLILSQAKDVAKFKINETLKKYDRGVKWDTEHMDIIGEQWIAAYLPVWLYSYQQIKGDNKILHYVAVNGRTKETMGSIPVHIPKLVAVSAVIEIIAGIAMLLIDFEYDFIFLAAGVMYYFITYSRYRNQDARHFHERDTKSAYHDLVEEESYIERRRGLTRSTMSGANNDVISNESKAVNHIDNIKEK